MCVSLIPLSVCLSSITPLSFSYGLSPCLTISPFPQASVSLSLSLSLLSLPLFWLEAAFLVPKSKTPLSPPWMYTRDLPSWTWLDRELMSTNDWKNKSRSLRNSGSL